MKRLLPNRQAAIFAVICAIIVSTFTMLSSVRAESWSWTSATPVVVNNDEAVGDFSWQDICASKFNSHKDNRKVVGAEDYRISQAECHIADGQNFQLFSVGQTLAVSFGGESNAHHITNVACFSYCLYFPTRDYYITVDYSTGAGGNKVLGYKNFISSLQRQTLIKPNLTTETYFAAKTQPDEIFTDTFSSQDYTATSLHMQRSSNDKWLVFEIVGKGMFRMDMDTGETLKFLDWRTHYRYSGPNMQMNVTDDGQRIAILGLNTVNSIYEITPGCGYILPPNPTEDDLLRNGGQVTACPEMQIGTVFQNDPNMPSLGWGEQPQFSTDGGELSFYTMPHQGSSYPPRQVTLRATGYVPPTQLDYLALGDSYSSGEGDTDKKPDGSRYYLAGTNVNGNYANGIPSEKCHISSRSYPFLLGTAGGITSDKVKSIACSGAKIADISGWSNKFSSDGKYLGQEKNGGEPRLKGLPNISQLQEAAKNDLIPGRVQQIEFVKRNKPRAITLTVGGNDALFADILRSCIMKVGLSGTCSWATSNQNDVKAPSLERIGRIIEGQYSALSNLYSDLKLASPKTKFYIIGYPQFINSTTPICPTNFGLNQTERNMITNSVSYMNQVIKAATSDAGFTYIDIENSLGDNVLCGLGVLNPYVNGTSVAAASFIGSQAYELQEAYHPNANGHNAIFNKIKFGLNNQTVHQFNGCNSIVICPEQEKIGAPTIPNYFTQGTLLDKIVRSATFVQSTVQDFSSGVANFVAGQSVNIQVPSFTFGSNGFLDVTIHSDPVDLGNFSIDDDGSLDTSITIPSTIPAGYHTITFTGITYSGDPIQYSQIILVRGQDAQDIDDDGIIDSNDKCLFINSSGIDIDKDGVDDACDPNLDDEPVVVSPSPSPTPTPTPAPVPAPANPFLALLAMFLQFILMLLKLVFAFFLRLAL